MENSGKRTPAGRETKNELLRLLGTASVVGINLVISTFIGFAIGYYLLDGYVFPELLSIHTFPWCTILFLLLGIASGFRYLVQVARKAGSRDSEG